MISDTTELRHHHISQLSVTPKYRLIHWIIQLKAALQGTPFPRSRDQICAIRYLQDTLNEWAGDTTPQEPTTPQPIEKEKWYDRLPPRVQQPVSRVQNPANIEIPKSPGVLVPRTAMPAQPVSHRTRTRHKPDPPAAPPKVPPMAPSEVLEQPVSHCTRSGALKVQPSQSANRKYPSDLLELWCTPAPTVLEALPVLDKESGNILEHRQLQRHPRLKDTWDTSYSNQLGRLCQGIGRGTVGPKNRIIKGTGTFKVIRFNGIPFEKRKDICHTIVVCEYRPDKDDPNRTRINITGGHILVPFDVVKLMINSVLSQNNARFAAFDIKNFYLDIPMENHEYAMVKLEDTPQEFIEEYHLFDNERHGWVYFEIVRGCYGLP